MFTAVLIRFVFLGSFVGGGILLVTSGLVDEIHGLPAPGDLFTALTYLVPAMVLASFLSVPIGVFPAAITGIAYWHLLKRHTRHNPSRLRRFALGGLLGMLASAPFGLLFSLGQASSPIARNEFVMCWALAGLFGGGFSALTVGDATYRHAFAN